MVLFNNKHDILAKRAIGTVPEQHDPIVDAVGGSQLQQHSRKSKHSGVVVHTNAQAIFMHDPEGVCYDYFKFDNGTLILRDNEKGGETKACRLVYVNGRTVDRAQLSWVVINDIVAC